MPWPALSIAAATDILTAPGAPFEIGEEWIRGVRQRVWRSGPQTSADLMRAARGHGDRTFLVHDDVRVSFAAFHRAVAAMARALIETGIQPGDRVAIAMRNLPEWPVAFHAAIAAGAIAVPLNAWWLGSELAYALGDSGARILVADAERAVRIAPHRAELPTLGRMLVCGTPELDALVGPPSGWSTLADDELPGIELTPETDAAILYTSGTSGKPKGALCTQRNMVANVTGAAFANARALLRRGEPLTAPHPDAPQQGALLGVPLFHGTGCFAWLNPALHAGRKVVLMHRWDATEALALIERERLTIVGGVPTIALQLVKHPDRLRHDLTSVRTVSYGGAAAPPDLIRWIRETFSNAVASHGWGMTETAALACTHSAEDYANRPTSCGPAVPVGEMQIRSIEDGAVLPAGEIGELWFKGPQVVKGYWNDPQATAETFIDGWVRTGDIARLDAEGFCYIVDRARDMVIRGGENIYCVEVENALHKHPDVVDAALLGMPHPLLGEEPVAVVALAPGATLDAAGLTAFAAGRLATFKVPARIHIWDRPLPRNANGKIIKRELKEALITPA